MTSQLMKTRVEIDMTKKIAEVSPFIFGNFIEFIQDCINGGIWAELITNRGFENNDDNKDGVSDPWYPTGYNDLGLYSLDAKECFNSNYSQKLIVLNHYGGYRGIAQKNIWLKRGENYHGYLWMKAVHIEGEITIQVKSKSKQPLFFKQLTIQGNGWNQYDFAFDCETEDEDCEFEIALAGTGELWLDQVSLMPRSAVDGVWEKVVATTKVLKPGIIRFPGGCFADCYHWEDGIGPKDNRPTRVNQHWKGNEENNFGTDEYIMFCRNTGSEPFICVNFGSGTPEEAANWVEYCNGSIETKYGKLRAINGHFEPYYVKYWDIGNETFADWEIGHCSARDFTHRYLEFYRAMKEKDSSIQVMACGGDGNEISQEWNRTLLKEIGSQIDHLTLHFYAPRIGDVPFDNQKLYYGTVGAVCKYEQIIKDTTESIKEFLAQPEQVKIAVTEWNTMYNNYSYREHTMEAAIFNAGMLNMFLRQSDLIQICNFSDLVNGWQGGCIRSFKGNVYLTPSYYTIQLYSNADLKTVVRTKIEGETYNIEAVGHVVNVNQVPYVDVVAGFNAQNEMVVFIINRHLEQEAAVQLNIIGAKLKGPVFTATISSTNPYDINTMEHEAINIKEAMSVDFNTAAEVIVAPCSIMRLIIPLSDEVILT